MRQYAGFGTPEETNRKFHTLLELGQTGLSIAFDVPTQLGYDTKPPGAATEGVHAQRVRDDWVTTLWWRWISRDVVGDRNVGTIANGTQGQRPGNPEQRGVFVEGGEPIPRLPHVLDCPVLGHDEGLLADLSGSAVEYAEVPTQQFPGSHARGGPASDSALFRGW